MKLTTTTFVSLDGVVRISRDPRAMASGVARQPERGLRILQSPQVEQVLVIQEELPVADDPMPHEQKRHWRSKRSEARLVDRSRLMAFVERPEHDSVFRI